MTHEELVLAAVRGLRKTRKCVTVLAEMVCANRCNLVPDAIGWYGEWSILVECKVSRSDFRADRKKLIHTLPDSHPGQERWYLTPPGLLKVEDLPGGWNLIEAHGKDVRVMAPVGVGRGPVGEDPIYKSGRSAAELPFLLSALRRRDEGMPFDRKTGRFCVPVTLANNTGNLNPTHQGTLPCLPAPR